MSVVFQKGSAANDTEMCERNLNLLAHAQAIELEIGSRCGGHGVCGGDRVRVLGAPELSSWSDAEREHLSEDELRSGWRLACQTFPQQNDCAIRIEVPSS